MGLDQRARQTSAVRRTRRLLARTAAQLDPVADRGVRDDLERATGELIRIERSLQERASTPRAVRPGPRALLTAAYLTLRTPRVGTLRQHAPQIAKLPRSYWRTSPPRPAPTISIVTPSFRHALFLERTIRSVLEQGYPALEYVVQDGGSNDGTVEIVERYAHRLAAWSSEPDEGQADALNRGFAHTHGEIMGFVNSDDLLLPGALATVASFFDLHPEVDVVYGDRVLVDDEGHRIGVWVLPPHDDRVLTIADYVPQETLFWRRRIWDAVGARVDPEFHYALDWDLLLRFRAAGAQIVHVPRFLGAFRVHDLQKTTAHEDVGNEESLRLRTRLHGRAIPRGEVLIELEPFFRRHVRAHLRYALRERLSPPWARRPIDL
jgi:glycosyltransferase involved in cell wall biosynthesis